VSLWTYCGLYKGTRGCVIVDIVLETSLLSTGQWQQLYQPIREYKMKETLYSLWGKAWCHEKGVTQTATGIMAAFNEGTLQWQVIVIECIKYDKNLLKQLVTASE
jgi:Domain of unknown function (DUF6697)